MQYKVIQVYIYINDITHAAAVSNQDRNQVTVHATLNSYIAS